MRKCNVCLKDKEETEFYTEVRRLDKLSPDCKLCRRESAKESYRRNPDKTKLRSSRARKGIRARRKALFDEIKLKYGCRLCPVRDLEVLDFHHYDPKLKRQPVMRIADKGIKMVIDEVNKCVILCANCHRKVHAGTKMLTVDLCCNESIPARLDGKKRHL